MSWNTGVTAVERRNIKLIEVRSGKVTWFFFREEVIQGSDPTLRVYCLCVCKKVVLKIALLKMAPVRVTQV